MANVIAFNTTKYPGVAKPSNAYTLGIVRDLQVSMNHIADAKGYNKVGVDGNVGPGTLALMARVFKMSPIPKAIDVAPLIGVHLANARVLESHLGYSYTPGELATDVKRAVTSATAVSSYTPENLVADIKAATTVAPKPSPPYVFTELAKDIKIATDGAMNPTPAKVAEAIADKAKTGELKPGVLTEKEVKAIEAVQAVKEAKQRVEDKQESKRGNAGLVIGGIAGGVGLLFAMVKKKR